jgi:uncharacterized YigZ family protein
LKRVRYRTIGRPARIEIEEKKSRFIAACRPLADEQAAAWFIQGERQTYPDASHHVYAWIVGGNTRLHRYCDDGEPHGTAGLPVFKALNHKHIEQAGIVVTRYFGGTLLGCGGLSRAYSLAATRVLEEAGAVDMCLCQRFHIQADYASYHRLQTAWRQKSWIIGDPLFGTGVSVTVSVPSSETENFKKTCADLTGGLANCEPDVLLYQPLPLPDPPR